VALLGSEWLASHPSCFTLGKGTPVTQWIEGKVGPKASLAFWRRKIFLPVLGIKPHFSSSAACSVVAIFTVFQNISYLQNFKIKKKMFWHFGPPRCARFWKLWTHL
jgi:hypothetical protein